MVAELVREMVPIKVADGTTMDAYVSRRKACGPCPMIIVLQELFGVNAHIRSGADRFAQQGSIAIAPELFHRTAPGFQGDYSDMNSAMPHMRALTPEMAEADLRATHDWLIGQDFAGPAGVSAVGELSRCEIAPRAMRIVTVGAICRLAVDSSSSVTVPKIPEVVMISSPTWTLATRARCAAP